MHSAGWEQGRRQRERDTDLPQPRVLHGGIPRCRGDEVCGGDAGLSRAGRRDGRGCRSLGPREGVAVRRPLRPQPHLDRRPPIRPAVGFPAADRGRLPAQLAGGLLGPARRGAQSMCGRYVITSPLDVLRQRFGFIGNAPDYRPRYNLAPRQRAPTVVDREGRVVAMMTWGLVPSWTKEFATAPRPINARAETAPGLASFRGPIRNGRVLVPATGFFEWKGAKGTKGRSPFLFRRRDGEPFAFAGLSDHWRSPDGSVLETFTILTVPPNDLVKSVHDRMPAILRSEHECAPIGRAEAKRWSPRTRTGRNSHCGSTALVVPVIQ